MEVYFFVVMSLLELGGKYREMYTRLENIEVP